MESSRFRFFWSRQHSIKQGDSDSGSLTGCSPFSLTIVWKCFGVSHQFLGTTTIGIPTLVLPTTVFYWQVIVSSANILKLNQGDWYISHIQNRSISSHRLTMQKISKHQWSFRSTTKTVNHPFAETWAQLSNLPCTTPMIALSLFSQWLTAPAILAETNFQSPLYGTGSKIIKE